jgi:Mn2+/Fe2+ NRAMP family transporter
MQAALRRNTELSLLILALLIGAGALALVAVARNLKRLDLAVPFIIIVVVCYAVAHFVVRKSAREASRPFIASIQTTTGRRR